MPSAIIYVRVSTARQADDGLPVESQAETERNFSAQLQACGLDAVVDGSSVGPYPVKHHPTADKALRRLREMGI